ncbi:hypothetical protein CLG96_08055 [Sphingomonas oleivorans]|uniref:Uncharacterized protein n=1 Tax=Sphingomonas oleivorans TaxID=1735121 RepID=A0A2T5FZ44_9SPHN|nr:hypothetical protein CLG96_08055 [Sphingomonas oleivorans]
MWPEGRPGATDDPKGSVANDLERENARLDHDRVDADLSATARASPCPQRERQALASIMARVRKRLT